MWESAIVKYSGIRIKSTPRDCKKLLTLSKVDFIAKYSKKLVLHLEHLTC